MTFEKGKTPEGAIPFKEGESGNPAGRPPGAKSFATILNKLLDLAASDEDYSDAEILKMFPDKQATNREIFMARMMIKAKRDSDSKSAERLMNRVEGRPIETVKQTVEINTENKISIIKDGKEISLRVDKPSNTE